ncbi:MAG: hypothetical protein EHM70_20980 [Chloroflexota bacterium]|nr:MAG: hypothetical protein EHM70_20980 [Chloroflexota bacterium]
MAEAEYKPLNWSPTPNVGYTVLRRPDGGMHFIFTDLSKPTLDHWQEFALQHLYDSDRLTRNLYDLRQIEVVPEEAVQRALEANSDPAARNIRLAVVVSNEKVRIATQKIADLTAGGGVEMGIFTSIDDAEAWLDRPLTTMI